MVAGGSDEEIYGKYAEELIRFATFLAGPSDAPDLLSEAMLKVLASKAWPTVGNHRAYLHRAVLNEARMLARRESRDAFMNDGALVATRCSSRVPLGPRSWWRSAGSVPASEPSCS